MKYKTSNECSYSIYKKGLYFCKSKEDCEFTSIGSIGTLCIVDALIKLEKDIEKRKEKRRRRNEI